MDAMPQSPSPLKAKLTQLLKAGAAGVVVATTTAAVPEASAATAPAPTLSLKDRVEAVRQSQPGLSAQLPGGEQAEVPTGWGNWHNGGWHNGGWGNWHNWHNW
jgi:hypothetical protein